MQQCNDRIAGLRSALSPSAPPFAVAPSSSVSEQEDPIWGDYTLDLSFLSSDDQKSSFLDDDDSLSNLSRDVDTTKDASGDVTINPNPLSSTSPEKLELSCANTTAIMPEKYPNLDDSEEDSPCWIGINSHKTLSSGAKAVSSRRSTDDLSGFPRLNPLAPQFIPSTSKKNFDKCEENPSSSSLKKSLSSTFPSSSLEFNLADPLEDGKNDAARRVNTLVHNGGEIFDFAPRDSVPKTLIMSDSIHEFQPSKRLDPLAPVFVPSRSKLSPSVHEKQGALDRNFSDTKPLNKFKAVACSAEVDHSFKSQSQYGVPELGTTFPRKPWSESKAGITDYAIQESSSNKSHGPQRLNPLAPQFSLADTKPKAYGYEKNQVADDLPLVVNTAPADYWDHGLGEADLAQSSVYVQYLLPNMASGGSSLISPKADSKWFAVEPETAFSVKGNKDFKHPLPFHTAETAAGPSSNEFKALSAASSKMDVKKLLTTMHGLSELLTLVSGSESSASPNAEELDLINSTVHNLKLYTQKQDGDQSSVPRHNSYDLKLLPNKSKLSIRDLQLPTTSNVTVNLDVKRKDKFSKVSVDSRLCEYGVIQENSIGQVVAKSGYQQNHQGEEQVNSHALFYKSLWLKAEAERCLMVYETSLSNPTS